MTETTFDDLDLRASGAPDCRSPHERELDEALQRIAAAAHERMREVLRSEHKIQVRRRALVHSK